jgi:hypothetical protein
MEDHRKYMVRVRDNDRTEPHEDIYTVLTAAELLSFGGLGDPKYVLELLLELREDRDPMESIPYFIRYPAFMGRRL